ncbi:hypothetical protein [Sinimarinibacterium flocculans]|uniref:Uncharacterized protein n=1 Tax=Sinimarinibacterium flocculans TaxID=985250 RepID=A0A318E999_9GAMM|nr:hypothetical protein [Sinimarinibacterium flocculans]PXV65816.1 hypothetical protein C8D93_109196 [Sinimarinibacterium flocculans]
MDANRYERRGYTFDPSTPDDRRRAFVLERLLSEFHHHYCAGRLMLRPGVTLQDARLIAELQESIAIELADYYGPRVADREARVT